jgi:hypothetical protein
MSELKVIDLSDIREAIENNQSVYYEYYAKSEVDEVIAKLNERIRKEREAKVNYKISANDLSDGLRDAYNEIRHQKYKRCVAKAEMCGVEYDRWLMKKANAIGLGKDGVEYYLKARRKCFHYLRWQPRWIKIAAKFKEAKNDQN